MDSFIKISIILCLFILMLPSTNQATVALQDSLGQGLTSAKAGST